MHECNQEAKSLRERLGKEDIDNKKGEDRSYVLCCKGQILDNSISESIGEIDAKKSEYKYARA